MQVVLANVDKPRVITYKGTTDLVTNTDQGSEDAILSVRFRHDSPAMQQISSMHSQQSSTQPDSSLMHSTTSSCSGLLPISAPR